MEKTRKSIFKRMRMTKRGQFLHAGSGINHFQAKKSRKKQLPKKRVAAVSKIQTRMIKDYIHY